MDLNRPIDKLKPQKQAILRNVRSSHKFGHLEPRPGLTNLSITGSHSIRRLNDPATARGVRVTGHSTSLYVDGASVDTGYSGDPIALIPHRPPQSPEAWMYCADSSRMRKVNVDSELHQIGLPAPTTAPTVALADNTTTSTFYKEIDDGDATTNWTADGTTVASLAASNPPRVDVTTVTITAVLYDSGTDGWCCVRPSDLTGINEGAYLEIEAGEGDAEQVLVQSVHFGTTATTIATNGILFDSGTAGACSIVLTTKYPKVYRDCMLYNSTDGTYAHVLDTYAGSDGLTGIRAVTPAGSTWDAGDTVYGVPSFRTWTSGTAQAADTLKAVGVTMTFSATAGTGNITKDIQGAPIDLTTIAAGVPATPDDYIHCSFRLSDPSLVTQGRILFDVTNDADAGNAFTKDYYYKVFRPDDLTPVALGDISELAGLQREAQRDGIPLPRDISPDSLLGRAWLESGKFYEVDYPPKVLPEAISPDSIIGRMLLESGKYVSATESQTELGLGTTWQELRFKISDLTRVGANHSVDLKNVYYIRIEFTVTDGALTTEFHSMGILGGSGPDSGYVGEGMPYIYRYRARCSDTGAVSNWSPASRNPIYARRQQINVVAPAQYDAATEADLLEWQRFGGTIRNWHIVGSVVNSAAPETINDDMPDDVAEINSSVGQVNYQPWPIIGKPVSGTATYVCGTTVLSSAAFSTSWAPGTRIEINQQVYSIYRVVSTSHIELFQSAQVATDAAFRVSEPVIVSQPLYALWGPLDGTLFSCGDPINPQRLYFLNRDSEGTTDTNYIDITSPSEPLQNGVLYNGRSYVFSSERLFEILHDGDRWTYVEIPGNKGLWAKWAFTGFQGQPGPYMCYLAKDGIYQSDGGPAISMTEADLNPLFPNEGNMGVTTNTILRPYMDSQYGAHFRLAYYDNHMYFDYNIVS